MSEEPVVQPLVNRKRYIIKRCHKLSWEIYKREARERKRKNHNKPCQRSVEEV